MLGVCWHSNMEEFILKIQTLSGIMEIIKFYDYNKILSTTAGIFDVSEEELSMTEIESFGKSGTRIGYGDVLSELVNTGTLWENILERFSDSLSKNILYVLLKYWLLPDPAFLDEIDCGNRDMQGFEIEEIGEIKEKIQDILDIKRGQCLKYNIKNVLMELPVIVSLLSILRKDFSFSIRMYGIKNIVLYAGVQRSKLSLLKKENKTLRVVCIAKDQFGWSNEELLKDKGLVPYFLNRLYGYDSTMVGVNNGDYPYLHKYVQGLEMLFLPDNTPESKQRWITEHAKDIDILIINGLYPVSMDIMKIYREKNPSGIIYLPLDANAQWMDGILHTDADFKDIVGSVDLIGTSGRKIQKHLNEKWFWPIEYIPNGYYHPWIEIDHIDYEKKENVILTVGRLGTIQKATNVMLEAFALAAQDIGDWTFKLVGGIEPSFEGYLENFWRKHPELKGKIVFIGKITDKTELFEEYKKAKIFTLTSILEGGAPNVIAEALHCGCAVATTEFDAYKDAIAGGKCGMSAKIGEVDGMASVYRNLCKNEERLKQMCEYAHDYAEMYFDMEKIVKRINHSLGVSSN